MDANNFNEKRIPDVLLTVLSFERVNLYCCTQQQLSVRPGTFLLPGAEYAPQIIFKTAAANLAVEQRLLGYNTYRRFLILLSDNFYWLLHLPTPRVAAKQHLKNFAKHEILTNLLYFREIFANLLINFVKILKYFLNTVTMYKII